MDNITAEQAAKDAKGLNFELVWAALMENKRQMKESQQETQKHLQVLKTELSKSIGGLGNSLGRLTESMFSAELCRKFNELGYPFNTQANYKKFYEDRQVIAEVDSVLENGEYVMLVEIKTDLSVSDVNDHLERISTIRKYMDTHGDNRKLVGAVAGGIVSENVLKYAQKKGFYVLVQTGEAIAVADMPPGFKAQEWC